MKLMKVPNYHWRITPKYQITPSFKIIHSWERNPGEMKAA